MSDIPNAVLSDAAVWAAAQSTVNGQPDDQTLDRICHQIHANRAAFLKQKLAAGFGTTKQLFNWISEEDSTKTRWNFYGGLHLGSSFLYPNGGIWQLDSVELVPLYFPLDFIPQGSRITGGSVKVTPTSQHSAVPENLPRFGVGYLQGNYWYKYSVQIEADNVGEYVAQTLTMSGLEYDVGASPHFLYFVGETGANSMPGLSIENVQVTYTNPFA